MTKLGRATRNDDITATVLGIDSPPKTTRSTPAVVPARGGGASAANCRQTGHERAKDDGKQVSGDGQQKGGKSDSGLERLKENFSQNQEQLLQEKAIE
jgi:hypothetical protein